MKHLVGEIAEHQSEWFSTPWEKRLRLSLLNDRWNLLARQIQRERKINATARKRILIAFKNFRNWRGKLSNAFIVEMTGAYREQLQLELRIYNKMYALASRILPADEPLEAAPMTAHVEKEITRGFQSLLGSGTNTFLIVMGGLVLYSFIGKK